jgi:hypothetical protein
MDVPARSCSYTADSRFETPRWVEVLISMRRPNPYMDDPSEQSLVYVPEQDLLMSTVGMDTFVK